MRLLTDENIPRALIRLLRERGHNVADAREGLRGERDSVLLSLAESEARVIITQDKDFGELAVRQHLPATCGVILFRLGGASRDESVARMLSVVESRTDWEGNLAVVTASRVRIRSLTSRDQR
jgi:predicted nuclease of predicted toxin-antitoxin system